MRNERSTHHEHHEHLDQLPEDVILTLMNDFTYAQIKAFGPSSARLNDICKKERFARLIEQKKRLVYFNGVMEPITSMKVVRRMIEQIIGPTFTYCHRPGKSFKVSEMGHNERLFSHVTTHTTLVTEVGTVIDVGSKFAEFSWDWEIEEGELLVYLGTGRQTQTVIIKGHDSSFKMLKVDPIIVPELTCDAIIHALFIFVPPDATSTKAKYEIGRTPDCQSQRYKGLSLDHLRFDLEPVITINKLRAVVIQIYATQVDIVFEKGKSEHESLFLEFEINSTVLTLRNYHFQ